MAMQFMVQCVKTQVCHGLMQYLDLRPNSPKQCLFFVSFILPYFLNLSSPQPPSGGHRRGSHHRWLSILIDEQAMYPSLVAGGVGGVESWPETVTPQEVEQKAVELANFLHLPVEFFLFW